MKNTVIKNESPEMGKEIIEYFKSLGIDTGLKDGLCCELAGHKHFYYGIIDGLFSNYDIDVVEYCEAEIITLPPTTTQEFKRGDKVLVWDERHSFCRPLDFVAYIKGAKHPFIVTRNVNANDFDYIGYKNCVHAPQKVKLTLQEIADKFKVDVDLIEIV